MAAVGDFAKETVNRLGPSAYLVNILPSAVIVLTTWALFASHLLPWDSSPTEGAAAVVQGARDLGIAGFVVLAVLVLIVAVLVRPFQISAVQLLEGYWHNRFGPRLFEMMAVERQVRRAEIHLAWARHTDSTSPDTSLSTFAQHYRSQRRRQRKAFDSQLALDTYPTDREIFLPTRLGNTLRKAETTAGEPCVSG